MKKAFYILAGLIGALVLAFVFAAVIIPNEKTFTQETEINASAQTVWQVINDRKKFPEWQDQIKKVEIIDESSWKEFPNDTDIIDFKITSRDELKSMDIEYARGDSFVGTWHGELVYAGPGKTVIKTTDKSVVNGSMMKVMMAMFFDIEDFAKEHNQKLKARCEKLEKSAS